MGVARKHALGMFSAKSLILHVLSGFAFHLFNQATQASSGEQGPVAPNEVPSAAKIVPTAKPIDKKIDGSTAAIRNKQAEDNRRARANYNENVMARMRAGQDITDTEGPRLARPVQVPKPAKPANIQSQEAKGTTATQDIVTDTSQNQSNTTPKTAG